MCSLLPRPFVCECHTISTVPRFQSPPRWEEQERTRRSLERRLRAAHIGRFKPLCDFDWTWPKRCDRAAFEALMALDFLKDATNAILVGPNGVGKSTLARISVPSPDHSHSMGESGCIMLKPSRDDLDIDRLRREAERYRSEAHEAPFER